MKHIICISFLSSARNFDTVIDFHGESFRISRFGADFDFKLMQDLIARFDGVADVIALQGVHPVVRLGSRIYKHHDSELLKNSIKHSPLVTGELLQNTYLPWALRSFAKQNPDFFRGKSVGFVSGLIDRALIDPISNLTENIYFFDAALHLGIDFPLKGFDRLTSYAKAMGPLLEGRSLNAGVHSGQVARKLKSAHLVDVVVSRASILERFSYESLARKTLLVDSVTPAQQRQLDEAGVKSILSFVPQIPALEHIQGWSFAILEALLQGYKRSLQPLSEDDFLEPIDELKLKPHYRASSSPKVLSHRRKFAFVIHPLHIGDIFRHPMLKPFHSVAMKFRDPFEEVASYLPAVHYGKISGVKSELTGVEVEGEIYTIFDTPRVMMRKVAEHTYSRLGEVCQQAAAEGCEIIGLGAYTKIVGDAGITVARKSPIPVTTGNSMSAAATLWAAREACNKLGFTPTYESGKIIKSKAMVIGATGSIGAVCAKMLANVVSDLVLCARTADRLLELKDEIEKLAPHCKVVLVTNPNKDSRNCDLIVTSTSSHDKRVLDIMTVKPGCVICDVSRPLDIREEDAIKRPDVLVVESGEIRLPGNFKMNCDIGTPESVVYACLAETALLALEGRMESFTLSRHIHYDKVREIYDIAKKHGAKLAHIRGHSGNLSDAEIDLCREHAVKALENWNLDG